MHAWPALKAFYARVPVYMQKDDHGTLRDDVHPGSDPLLRFSCEDAIPLWYEQTPVTRPPYRTFRWGRLLQIWLVRTVEASNATFKLFFSPSAVVGPDRDNKHDNHANAAFQTEGRAAPVPRRKRHDRRHRRPPLAVRLRGSRNGPPRIQQRPRQR